MQKIEELETVLEEEDILTVPNEVLKTHTVFSNSTKKAKEMVFKKFKF